MESFKHNNPVLHLIDMPVEGRDKLLFGESYVRHYFNRLIDFATHRRNSDLALQPRLGLFANEHCSGYFDRDFDFSVARKNLIAFQSGDFFKKFGKYIHLRGIKA